jgi:hypothetical protein
MKPQKLQIYLATVVLLVIALVLPSGKFLWNDKYWIMGSILIFLFNTLFAMRKISGAVNVSQSKFNAIYFGSMGLKMILALIFIVIYLNISTIPNKFAVVFMLITYFIYTGFEIQFILSKLRTNSEKDKNGEDARK